MSNSVPNTLEIHLPIVVGDDVSHASNFPERNAGKLFLNFR